MGEASYLLVLQRRRNGRQRRSSGSDWGDNGIAKVVKVWGEIMWLGTQIWWRNGESSGRTAAGSVTGLGKNEMRTRRENDGAATYIIRNFRNDVYDSTFPQFKWKDCGKWMGLGHPDQEQKVFKIKFTFQRAQEWRISRFRTSERKPNFYENDDYVLTQVRNYETKGLWTSNDYKLNMKVPLSNLSYPTSHNLAYLWKYPKYHF